MDLPFSLVRQLMHWFEEHRREMPWRGSQDPYHIWASEVMLQQTQVATVEKYYPKWIQRFPDVFSLAEASLEEVLKVWEGLGYYTRARNFHKAAKYIVEQAESRGRLFPQTYEEWLKVPGVGPYTAAAVSSIAFRYPAAVLDANVLRLMARLFCLEQDSNDPQLRRELFTALSRSFYNFHPGWVNQAWMELGSLHCKVLANCSNCPLKNYCSAFSRNAVSIFPRKKAGKILPLRSTIAFALFRGEHILLLRRAESGFLGGLWEFPSFTVEDAIYKEASFRDFIRNNNLLPEQQALGSVRHSYSHFHQHVQIFAAELKGEWENSNWIDFCWADSEKIKSLALSGVSHKILNFLHKSGKI